MLNLVEDTFVDITRRFRILSALKWRWRTAFLCRTGYRAIDHMRLMLPVSVLRVTLKKTIISHRKVLQTHRMPAFGPDKDLAILSLAFKKWPVV
jgi:hypothetical protein